MVQIYCGDGKGKTTASIGLAVRASSYGIPVIFAQFLKDDSSGEIKVLRSIDGITVMHSPSFYGFVRNMTENQKKEVKDSYRFFIEEIHEKVRVIIREHDKKLCVEKNEILGADTEKNKKDVIAVVVLDEILHALNYRLADEKQLMDILNEYKDRIEFVLTGRNPSKKIIDIADYYTVFKKVKHAYDDGISAREGIEF